MLKDKVIQICYRRSEMFDEVLTGSNTEDLNILKEEEKLLEDMGVKVTETADRMLLTNFSNDVHKDVCSEVLANNDLVDDVVERMQEEEKYECSSKREHGKESFRLADLKKELETIALVKLIVDGCYPKEQDAVEDLR